MTNPRIFVPANDPPTHHWLCDYRGWRYWTGYWPTDGKQNSHPHDLTGIAWKDGVVMVRDHLGFKVWDLSDHVGCYDGVAYSAESHNPKRLATVLYDELVANNRPVGITELTPPEPLPRIVAEIIIGTLYDLQIKPDLTHDRQVTPPWSWSDPHLQAYWQHHRRAWWLRCLTYGISPRTQPWEIFWRAPDMCYNLLTKR